MAYNVIDLDSEISHGVFENLIKARECVRIEQLTAYQIWRGYMDEGAFLQIECVEDCQPCGGYDNRAAQSQRH